MWWVNSISQFTLERQKKPLRYCFENSNVHVFTHAVIFSGNCCVLVNIIIYKQKKEKVNFALTGIFYNPGVTADVVAAVFWE